MKHQSAFIFLLAIFSVGLVHAQSVSELEARMKRSGSKTEKMNIAYQIAEKLLATSPAKASDYAQTANQLATELGDKRKEADAAYLSAEGQYRARNFKEAAIRYQHSWNSARNFGLREIALNSTEKLQDIALKQNDYREALKWSRETVVYLKEAGGSGRSGGDAQRRLENQIAAAEADNRKLREQIAQITGQTQILETTYQSQLKEVQDKTQQELSQKEMTISQISTEKQRLDSIARVTGSSLESMTREQVVAYLVDGRRLPTSWSVSIADRGLKIDSVPVNARSWMGTRFAYWEGPISFKGSHSGIGYLEMTGY